MAHPVSAPAPVAKMAASMSLAGRAGFALLLRFDLPLAGAIEWIPTLEFSLAWRIDGLAALIRLMITGVGCAVFAAASRPRP